MAQDNAVHIKSINGTPTMFDIHGVSLGGIGGGGLTEPLELTEVLTLASLTTVERDALIPVEGMTVYNSTDDEVQVYQDGAWISVGGGGGSDPFGWNPAKYVGTYDAGTTYAYGDAVRANDSGTWKLYISLVADNLNNDPVADDGSHWLNTVAAATPVIVQGLESPVTTEESTRVTEYDLGNPAPGGTFDLGTALNIDAGSNQADIQAALDAEYGVGPYVVSSDSPIFTVTTYGDALILDAANVTGGGTPTQIDTQDFVVGGFVTGEGSVYIQQVEEEGASISYFTQEVWQSVNLLMIDSAASGLTAGIFQRAVRSGSGQGHADIGQQAVRDGSGNGSAYTDRSASRQGTGTGDADVSANAAVVGTAVGAAIALASAFHHTGGEAKVGPYSDSDGAKTFLGHPDAVGLKISDLPNVDPALATPEIIYNALVAAGLALDGS